MGEKTSLALPRQASFPWLADLSMTGHLTGGRRTWTSTLTIAWPFAPGFGRAQGNKAGRRRSRGDVRVAVARRLLQALAVPEQTSQDRSPKSPAKAMKIFFTNHLWHHFKTSMIENSRRWNRIVAFLAYKYFPCPSDHFAPDMNHGDD